MGADYLFAGLVLALACWRFTNMVLYERGPWRAFAALRERLFDTEHDVAGQPVSWADDELGWLTRCLDCGSVWVGLGLAGLYVWSPSVALVLALPFALSGAAILVGRCVNNGQG